LMLAGIPMVTVPAPARNVACAQSNAAPENLLDPAKINTFP